MSYGNIPYGGGQYGRRSGLWITLRGSVVIDLSADEIEFILNSDSIILEFVNDEQEIVVNTDVIMVELDCDKEEMMVE